jgi:hypothetical protein
MIGFADEPSEGHACAPCFGSDISSGFLSSRC